MFKKYMNAITSAIGANDNIKKSEFLVQIESLERVLKETTENNSKSLQELLKKQEGKTIVNLLNKYGMDLKDNADIAKMLNDDYTILVEVIKESYKLVDDYFPEISIQDTLTFRQNAIIDFASHADVLTNFYSELLMLIVYNMNGETQIIYKKKTADIAEGIAKYESIMKLYRRGVHYVVEDIKDLSDTRIIENKEVLKEVASTKDLTFALPINGFNGNPIQWLGKRWVDLQFARADSAEDKKHLVELKLIHLKDMKERGTTDTNIDKQIEYFENRVRKLDKKIAGLRKV